MTPDYEDRALVSDNASYVHACCVNTLETAIRYYNLYGFNVIPIPKPNERREQRLEKGGSKSKIATADRKSAAGYESWKDLQDRRQEMEDVIRRFKGKEDCNIGILTGTALGILAFDIDGEEAYTHYVKEVQKLADDDISARNPQCHNSLL